ncbi:sushi, von Willebrand factor type a, egf and pentraxin domain-containing protein 1-like, partial [Plakobranchus ocellatus]
TVFCTDSPPDVANSESHPDGIVSVAYTCSPYYHRSGTTFVSYCDRVTKRWSAVDMTCSFVDCQTPPQVEGATSSDTSTYFDAKVTYTCLDGGASSSPSMSIICQENSQWTDPPEPCVLVSCGPPTVVPNTLLQLLRRPLTNALPGTTEIQLAIAVGGTVTYTCKPGTPFTQSSTPAVTAASLTTTFESLVYYSCHTGYAFRVEETPGVSINQITLSCNVNGTWDQDDSPWNTDPDVEFHLGCMPVDCGLPANINHARVEYNSTLSNSSAIYSCVEPAFSNMPDDRDAVVCGTNAQWSDSTLECTKVPCGLAPTVNHSNVEYTYDSSQRIVANFSCHAGYNAGSGSTILECDENLNEWEQREVVCQETTCGLAPPVANTVVVETGQKVMDNAFYTCNQGFKMPAINGNQLMNVSRTCTSQGTWSQETVTCEPITCSPPIVPQLASFDSTVKSSYNYGEIVKFKCLSPHILESSNNSQVMCAEDGWQNKTPGEEINCVEMSCGEVPLVANAESSLRHLDSPVVVIYTCLLGHEFGIAGADRKTCLNDGGIFQWSGEDVVCEPVDCGQPIQPQSGTRALFNLTTYGASVAYTCDMGYRATAGNATSICKDDGRWSSDPLVCEIIDCGGPVDWPNASLSYNSTSYNSVASYSCQEGYPASTWESTCLASGEWNLTHFLNCSFVDCGSPKYLTNGSYSFNNSYFNSKVSYQCDPGYFFFGNTSDDTPTIIEKICTESGEWQILGQETNFELFCAVPLCSDPPSFSNAELQVSREQVTKEVNSTVAYRCVNGFELIGNNILKCGDDLKWSYPYFECIEIDCGSPLDVQNATMVFTTTTVGSVVTFTCDKDYEATRGSIQKTCLPSGRWSDNLVECVINGSVSCGEPPNIEHATSKYSSTLPGSIAMYTCDNGYKHTWVNNYRCLSIGYWVSPAVLCKPVDCGDPPAIVFATILPSTTTYGAIAHYQCNEGTRAVFGNSKTCSGNGSWSDDFVECLYLDEESCGSPKGIKNSHLLVFNGTKGGSTTAFYCDEGYEGSSFIITCSQGAWVIPASASCQPVDCGPAPILSNTVAHVSGTTFGSVVRYECLSGLAHTGPSLKVCEANRLWTENIVECKPAFSVSCGNPPYVDNTEIYFSSRLPNSFALYNCSDGYTGSIQFTCLASGQWSKSNIDSCEPVVCSSPASPALHSHLKVSKTFGSITAFVCQVGYMPTNPSLSYCLANGEWSVVRGECTEISEDPLQFCPSNIPDVANSVRTVTTYHVGSKVSYTCSPGFLALPFSSLIRVCLPSLDWSDHPLKCEPTICIQRPTLPHAHFESTAVDNINWVLITTKYICAQGYSSDGEPVNTVNTHIRLQCYITTGWQESMDQCLPITCGSPPLKEHAIYTLVSGNMTYLSEAQYECVPPYYQEGTSNSSTCQHTGTWSTLGMTCTLCDQTSRSPIANSTLSLIYRNAYEDTFSRVYKPVSEEATLNCDDWFYFIGNSSRFHCASVNGQPQWVGDDVFCAQVYWKDPVQGVDNFYVYSEAITKKLTMCSNFTYVGRERILFSVENKTGDITKSPARVLWYDDYSQRVNNLRFRSKTADSIWQNRVTEDFDLAVGSDANFCLVLDVEHMQAQFLSDGIVEMEMPILHETPYWDITEVKLYFDVEISEFRITYE